MHKEPINGKKSLIKTTVETREGGKCNVQRVRLSAGYKRTPPPLKWYVIAIAIIKWEIEIVLNKLFQT